jgi:hypothetical protein
MKTADIKQYHRDYYLQHKEKLLERCKKFHSENREKVFRIERDLVETKDLLKSLSVKLDNFIGETNDKFTDFETAITDIEKQIPCQDLSASLMDSIATAENVDTELDNSAILSVDLKNIIKQELASHGM